MDVPGFDFHLSDVYRARRNTLADLLQRTSARNPHRLAVVYGQNRLTYKELNELVNQTAWLLDESGIAKGMRVALLSRNSLDFVVLNFAIARIGAIMVPLNYMLSVQDLAYILHHSKVSALAASAEFAGPLDEAAEIAEAGSVKRYLMDTDTSGSPDWTSLDAARATQTREPFEAQVEDGDVAHILYTSGTESRPKGVMLTHGNLVAEYVSTIIDGRMEARDVAIHALPLYHSAQLHCFLGPGVYIGSSGIVLSGASPDLILETIEREKVTQLFCPPTVWIALLRHPDFSRRDLSTLEKCYYGAAIMPMEVLKELSERLPNAKFWNFYGQTEVAPLATVLQPDDQLRKLGSAGKPALNVETKIMDDFGNELPPGSVGEIVHRTAHAMLGYLFDEDKTRQAFDHGWFHSGDLGVMDDEGYLTVVDRKKDMIKSGGENVSSREVEEFLYTLPGVSEVAVIAVPDPYWIEAVAAVIVPKADAQLNEQDILDRCRQGLSKFKVPKYITFTEGLPKNPSGKILKRELRQAYQHLAEGH